MMTSEYSLPHVCYFSCLKKSSFVFCSRCAKKPMHQPSVPMPQKRKINSAFFLGWQTKELKMSIFSFEFLGWDKPQQWSSPKNERKDRSDMNCIVCRTTRKIRKRMNGTSKGEEKKDVVFLIHFLDGAMKENATNQSSRRAREMISPVENQSKLDNKHGHSKRIKKPHLRCGCPAGWPHNGVRAQRANLLPPANLRAHYFCSVMTHSNCRIILQRICGIITPSCTLP